MKDMPVSQLMYKVAKRSACDESLHSSITLSTMRRLPGVHAASFVESKVNGPDVAYRRNKCRLDNRTSVP